jgi:hypothetical protein
MLAGFSGVAFCCILHGRATDYALSDLIMKTLALFRAIAQDVAAHDGRAAARL